LRQGGSDFHCRHSSLSPFFTVAILHRRHSLPTPFFTDGTWWILQRPADLQTRLDSVGEAAGNGHCFMVGKDVDTVFK